MSDATTATSDPVGYAVTVDRDACDGVFACLVRDPRFVEDDDGLAGFDPDAAETVERTDESVTATFADDRIEEARQAAAACPLDAIAVALSEGDGEEEGEVKTE
ncbi:ferredoxin [Halorubrum halophilum]|uniref:ferredoxin n=1 Tax=Halorubrum halophilum TaxID=413816 RepID=UPI00067868D3|nr:ferredoxin [Halorubrum halophilum]